MHVAIVGVGGRTGRGGSSAGRRHRAAHRSGRRLGEAAAPARQRLRPRRRRPGQAAARRLREPLRPGRGRDLLRIRRQGADARRPFGAGRPVGGMEPRCRERDDQQAPDHPGRDRHRSAADRQVHHPAARDQPRKGHARRPADRGGAGHRPAGRRHRRLRLHGDAQGPDRPGPLGGRAGPRGRLRPPGAAISRRVALDQGRALARHRRARERPCAAERRRRDGRG